MSHALKHEPIVIDYTSLSNGSEYLTAPRIFSNLASSQNIAYYAHIKEQKQVVQKRNIRDAILGVEALKKRPKNWDGNGSAKPNSLSISAARRFLELFFETAANYEHQIHQPLYNTDEDGDVVCEWWGGKKKLTIDITATSVEYRKIRNIDGHPEIEFGQISNAGGRAGIAGLIDWFLNGA